MISQKLISVKLDSDLLDSLDSFCESRSIKRNRLINDLIRSCLVNMSTFQITRLIAEYAPDVLPIWYKSEYGIDSFDN